MSLQAVLPPMDLFLPFMAAGIALNLTPGSDMSFVALSGARGGRTAGLAAAAGIFAGCLGHILFAVFGLSALIAASQTAFAVVKWIGVAYLVFLAVQLARSSPAATGELNRGVTIRPSNAFRQAAIVNLLNPKVGIFFLAFLPQFIEPSAASPWKQILALGIVFNTTGAIVNSIVGLASAAAARSLGSSPRLSRVTRWLAATIMGGLAIRLALSRAD
jgi:threonine/homoserine/homoserine lactone efflux protein